MFGRKRAEIANLRAQNEELSDELAEVRPWIGLARNIQERTAEFAARTDIDQAVNLAMQQASEEDRQAFVVAAFKQLGPDSQLELLVKAFGDSILLDALQQERARRVAEYEKYASLRDIIDEARAHRRLRFSSIPTDSRVSMFFYDQDMLLSDKNDVFTKWVRRLDGIIAAPGRLMIQEDHLRFTYSADYVYDDYEQVAISPANAEPESPLYYGLLAYMPRAQRFKRFDRSITKELGPVFINGIEIFGVLPEGTVSEQL